MSKKKKNKEFTIVVDIYNGAEVSFVFNENIDEVSEWIESKIGDYSGFVYDKLVENNYGLFFNKGGDSVIWMPKVPESPEEYGTLMHEIFHSVIYILDYIGMKFSEKSEEAYTYLMAYIVENVFINLSSSPKKRTKKKS